MGSTKDNHNLPIVRELRNIVLNSNRLFKIIQIISSSKNDPIVIFDDESNNTLDIGITKEAYLTMFKQCHDYWYSYMNNEISSWDQLSATELDDLYLATLGYLVTANDHHSIMNLHENLVIYLDNYDTDMEIVSCFLTSHLKRINKSSLLWNWMKHLSVINIYKPLINGEQCKTLGLCEFYNIVISRTFRSCQNHYMNYYANNFIHWVMLMNSNMLGLDDEEILFTELHTQCHGNLLDSSLWINFKNYINCQQDLVDMEFVTDEWQRICNKYNISVNKIVRPQVSKINTEELIISEFKWLIKVDCKYNSPFQALVGACHKKTTLSVLKELLRSSNNTLLNNIIELIILSLDEVDN